MKVLSCFDGISCGRLALERAGIAVDAYLASEIEPHAINVVRRQRPDTAMLGDIRDVVKLAWQNKLGPIDLLIGGSPCQGFSSAGFGAAFSDPRSKLLMEFVALKT